MGITYETAKLLKNARSRGVDYAHTLQVGRQNLIMGRAEVRRLGLDPSTVLPEPWAFAEHFFKALGALAVDSLDASAFEGASITLDLNRPVPTQTHGQFSAVVDVGTIEHVFDVARCLHNYMVMVRPGGHVILHTPSNNYLEHGFHQFGPQLFEQVFHRKNGFELIHLLQMEYAPTVRFWRPSSDAPTRESTTVWPTAVYVEARRIGDVPAVLDVQQQSYATEWSRPSRSPNFGEIYPVGRKVRWRLLELFPRTCRMAERLYRGIGRRIGRTSGFTPTTP